MPMRIDYVSEVEQRQLMHRRVFIPKNKKSDFYIHDLSALLLKSVGNMR